MAIKLSIIIPCYNMAGYVSETINSVLSYPDQDIIEIIVVNDGSTDNSRHILDVYNIKNLKVVHQDNQGLAKARNNAIKIARGEYVLPLDADNKIRHVYIKKGIEVLDKHPNVGVCFGNLERFQNDDRIVEVGEFDISKLIVKNYIDACVVLRKEAWQSVNGYDEQMPVMGYEDWDINMRLFFKGWQFYYINELCFDYRVRENSMLVNSNRNKELLVSYMFAKPSLKQVAILRKELLDFNLLKDKYNNMKERKIIRIALIIEKKIKKILDLNQ